jgi:hypothetical protein
LSKNSIVPSQLIEAAKINAFIKAQSQEQSVSLERNAGILYMATIEALITVPYVPSFNRWFQPDGPDRIQVSQSGNEVNTMQESLADNWMLTRYWFLNDGRVCGAMMTHTLVQNGLKLFRQVTDTDCKHYYWIPKQITDLLAETVEDLNLKWRWQLSPLRDWVAVLSLQQRCSMLLRTAERGAFAMI